MTSADPEDLAREAYEAYCAAHPTPLPPWEDIGAQERAAWNAAASAIAGKQKGTRAMAVPARALLIKIADRSHTFDAEFTVGREGSFVIDDEFASGRHARFQGIPRPVVCRRPGLDQRHLAEWAPHPGNPVAEER